MVAPAESEGGPEHKMNTGKIKPDSLASSSHGAPYGEGQEFDPDPWYVGKGQLPPVFFHSFLAILASPEVTATKKKEEGGEKRKGGSEGGEKFSYTEYLRVLQSGILKSHLHLPRNTGNLAVS